MLGRPGVLPAFVEPGNGPGRQLRCWEMKASLLQQGRVVKVFIASRQINKLDTRGSLFTCVSLTCTDDQRFWLLFSQSHTHTHTRTHSEGLATGVQPCFAVESKHWPVLTGCDPCFRAECCQRRIDDSHPEEDVYREIFLAGIRLYFILGSKQWFTVIAVQRQSLPRVMMKKCACVFRHTHFCPSHNFDPTFTLTLSLIWKLSLILKLFHNLVSWSSSSTWRHCFLSRGIV